MIIVFHLLGTFFLQIKLQVLIDCLYVEMIYINTFTASEHQASKSCQHVFLMSPLHGRYPLCTACKEIHVM